MLSIGCMEASSVPDGLRKSGGWPAKGRLEYQSMKVRIVLVGAQHPGNIGSAARAMKTMGLADLALVAPERFPAPEAVVMAAAADDVLGRARIFGSVREAIADCGLIVGTTARARHLPWLVVEPREAAREIVTAAASATVAILFGAERTGLSNEDLEQCQRLLTIPCDAAYPSLNLAMAVQVVAYELWLAAREPCLRGVAAGPHASAEEMEHFYAQLAEVMDQIDFRDRTGSGHLMARLRRFFNRAAPDENEIHILRGILTAVQGRRRRAGEPHRATIAPRD
jgi:TrmH family RNA methyltransferase